MFSEYIMLFSLKFVGYWLNKNYNWRGKHGGDTVQIVVSFIHITHIYIFLLLFIFIVKLKNVFLVECQNNGSI